MFVEKNTNIDKRKGIIKSINKFGRVIEFTKLKGRDLNNWIEKAFKKYRKTISYNNINYFIQHSSYFDRDINKSLYDLENEIIKLVASQGVFAIFFAYLLFYVLKENSKREGKYQDIISTLTDKFSILDDVKKSVDKIEEKLER
ncbi:hypothetical protein CFK35_18165 [Clostridium sp. cpc1]|nr:hypothetical protein [Clostridium sp. cpc1]